MVRKRRNEYAETVLWEYETLIIAEQETVRRLHYKYKLRYDKNLTYSSFSAHKRTETRLYAYIRTKNEV